MDLKFVDSPSILKTVNSQTHSEENNNTEDVLRTCLNRSSILETYDKASKWHKDKSILLGTKEPDKKREIQRKDTYGTKLLPEKKQTWLLCCLQDASDFKENINKEELEYSLYKTCTESSESLGKAEGTINHCLTDTNTLEFAYSRKNMIRIEAADTCSIPNILHTNEYNPGSTILVANEEENQENVMDEKGSKIEIHKIRSNHKRKQVLKVRHEMPASNDTTDNYEQSNNKNKSKNKIGNKRKNLLSDLFGEKRLTESSQDKKIDKQNKKGNKDVTLSEISCPLENNFIPSLSSYSLSEKSSEIYEDENLCVAGDERTKDPDLHDYSSEYALNGFNCDLNKPDYIDCLKTNFLDFSDSDEIHKLLCPILDVPFDENGNNINVYNATKSADDSSNLLDCESLNLTMSDSGTSFDNIFNESGNAGASDKNFTFSDVEDGEASDDEDIPTQQRKAEKLDKACKEGETEAASFVPSNEFQCPLCSLSFKTSRTLAMHRIGAHGGPFIFQCETCGLLFNKKYTLNRHSIDCLHRERRFICTICDKNYKHRSSLLLHARKIHQVSSISRTSYICQVCSKEYRNHSAFEKHLSLHSRW